MAPHARANQNGEGLQQGVEVGLTPSGCEGFCFNGGGDGVGEPAGWCAALVKDLADAPGGGIDGHAEMCADGGMIRKKTLQIPNA